MFQNPVISKDILRLDEGVRQKLDPSFLLAHCRKQKGQATASRKAGQVPKDTFPGARLRSISRQDLLSNSI